jgi:ech hydrogenase subunit F
MPLTGMTLKNLFRKPATKMYPLQAPQYSSRSKGHVTNIIEDCILCGICEKRCPTHAITVDKAAESWTIDNFNCIQCLSCVRACPKKCLVMEPEYTKAATSKSTQTVTKPALSEAEQAAKAAREQEKQERIAAALAKKAAKQVAEADTANE